MNDLLPQNPTLKQRKAFNKRQIEIKIAAEEQIRRISMESAENDFDADDAVDKSASSDSKNSSTNSFTRNDVTDEMQSSSNNETSGQDSRSIIIQMDGVKFRRNDECEFRRVVI